MTSAYVTAMTWFALGSIARHFLFWEYIPAERKRESVYREITFIATLFLVMLVYSLIH